MKLMDKYLKFLKILWKLKMKLIDMSYYIRIVVVSYNNLKYLLIINNKSQKILKKEQKHKRQP